MTEEVAKRDESLHKKRRVPSSKFSSTQKLKLNMTMEAEEPRIVRLKQ